MANDRKGCMVSAIRGASNESSRRRERCSRSRWPLVVLPAGGARGERRHGTPGLERRAARPRSVGSAHVTSVRITGVTCTPSSHCSANPHQVSTHGTLLVKGVGLQPGMVLGFPKKAGARGQRALPASRAFARPPSG